jgi:hypothetical protein
MLPPGCCAAGRNPASNQPKATKQPTLHNTQTMRNACRFGVVCDVMCAVCCMSPPGCWAVGRKPTSKQHNAVTQQTLHNTQTIRNACRFGVVCGVCCVLHVASGLLGCRPQTNPTGKQPKATKQPTLHNTENHAKRPSDQCCMWCVFRVACRLRVAGLSGENPGANNTM